MAVIAQFSLSSMSFVFPVMPPLSTSASNVTSYSPVGTAPPGPNTRVAVPSPFPIVVQSSDTRTFSCGSLRRKLDTDSGGIFVDVTTPSLIWSGRVMISPAATALSEEVARSLLAELPDAAVRERVVGEAAGNPLFLRELGRLARHGETTLPATLTAAVGLDVAALEPAARVLIAGAAVAGDRFDPELAAAAAGLEPDAAALDRLVAAELIRSVAHPPGRSFAFRHPLVRRVVYDGAPPAWRLDAHERAAAALARRGAGPAVRAYHVARFARPGDDAAIALLTAAAEAAAEPSPATAAHWYGAALRLLPDDDARPPRPPAGAAGGRARERRPPARCSRGVRRGA